MLSDTYCGSTAYSAPEVLRSQPYSPLKADVWSTGVVLFVLLNNKLPFHGDNDAKKMSRRQTDRKYNFKNKALTSAAREVIGLLFTPDPVQRPSMMEILANPWFEVPAPKCTK